MPWNPLSAWPREQPWVWTTLAVWIVLLNGPAFIENMSAREWQTRPTLPDFIQEWSSARNYFDGLPIYTNLATPIERYLGSSMEAKRSLIVVNAHPPTSVLLALPFACLDFGDAFLVWNILSLLMLALSLWLVQRELKIPFAVWSILPLTVFLLLCSPLWQQIYQGQLNLVLLPLLTGTWAAERAGRYRLAGVLLGAAITIKLFPGFLLVYFLLRRRWVVVTAAVVTVAVITAVTAAVLGVETYQAYVRVVLPEIQWFRVGWNNNSTAGFWYRLFDGAPEKKRAFSRSAPLWYSPGLASVATWISSAIVVGVFAWTVRDKRSREDGDMAFALAVTTMLLISPITWEHYFLLLLAPLAIFWLELPASKWIRLLFATIVMALWTSPALVWTVSGIGGRVARPIDNVTIISYQFYALLALLALGVRLQRQGNQASLSNGA